MSWDPVWEEVFNSQEWGKYPPECLIRFIARNFYKKDRKNVKILEVGCGTGANIWYVSREGFDVYGIDGSKTAISIAEARLEKENLKADLKIGNILNLPYDESYFDAVIDIECLYSNSEENTLKIISEMKRVLKKEGLFFSKTFTENMYIGKNSKQISKFEFKDISDGPLYKKGFVRLMDEKKIKQIYGKFFNINSIELLEESFDNQQNKISEWLITSQK